MSEIRLTAALVEGWNRLEERRLSLETKKGEEKMEKRRERK